MDLALINRVKDGSLTTLNLNGKSRRKKRSSNNLFGFGESLGLELGRNEPSMESKEEIKEEQSMNNSPELAALLVALAGNTSVTQLRLAQLGLDMQAARCAFLVLIFVLIFMKNFR